MIIKILILSVLINVIFACNSSISQQDNTIVPYILKQETSNSKNKLSELFTNHYRVIPLETNKECLVGRIDKIIKRDSIFYILSNDSKIQSFDYEGQHLSTFENIGRGPDEYTYIGDFDIYDHNGKKEIWLCDMDCIKIYNEIDMQHVKTIHYPFVINKFKKTTDDHILLMTGQNKTLISLSDLSGNIIDSCLTTKVTNTMLKPMQFIPYKDKLIYQFDFTNGCMIYDQKHSKFQQGFIVAPENNWLSELQYDELFKKHDYDAFKFLKNYTYIKTFRYFKNNMYIVTHEDNKRYLHIISQSKQQTIQFSPNSKIYNDIFSSKNDLNFISSINMGDSDDSILIILEPSNHEIRELSRGSNSKRIISKINENANPVILEYY